MTSNVQTINGDVHRPTETINATEKSPALVRLENGLHCGTGLLSNRDRTDTCSLPHLSCQAR